MIKLILLIFRKQRFLFQLCLNSLAISDLFFVVLTTTIYISKLKSSTPALWELGEFACITARYLQTFGMLVSSIFLTCIAIDRYVSVKHFDKNAIEPKKTFCVLCCIVIWGFSAVVTSPILGMYNHFQVHVIRRPDRNIENSVPFFYTGYMCGRNEVNFEKTAKIQTLYRLKCNFFSLF